MTKKKEVLHVAAEAAPFAKVGGLADVVGSLPIALNRLDTDYRAQVVIPCYELIDKKEHNLKKKGKTTIHYQGHKHPLLIWQTKKDHTDFYFIENKNFLGGSEIYLDVDSSKKDNQKKIEKEARRFQFFGLAVAELLETGHLSSDIIHCHDWHSAPLIPFAKSPVMYTIHNLANQGPGKGEANYMELGIRRADIVTTVSPSYRDEILTEEFGRGLEDVLSQRSDDLYGIINGLSYDEWSPDDDKVIEESFTWKDLSLKQQNKSALQKELGLEDDNSKMLIGGISRLTAQKGLKTAAELFKNVDNVQWVILGTGQKEIEKTLKNSGNDKGNVKVVIDFNLELARKIYAGSDLFFMPSRFEPCGLGQMIAMRYGALPLVRNVGGLKDTVSDLEDGFVFEKDEEIKKTVEKAKDIFQNEPKRWEKMQKKAIKKDFSWSHSAKKYLNLYKKLLKS